MVKELEDGSILEELDMRNLNQRISSMQEECRDIPKKGWNKHFKYAFVRKEDLVRAVTDSMVRNGVVASTVQMKFVAIPNAPPGVVGVEATTSLRLASDRDHTGPTVVFQGVGGGADSQDKGPAKAQSMAIKYMWANGLHISFGDDDAEEDGGTAEGPREEEAPPQRQRKEEPRRQTAPAQDTRPAQQTAPAQAVALPEVQLNRNMTMGFGRGAVVPLKDLSDDDLSYYIAMVSKNLANPAQKTHANTNAVRLAHLLAEQALGAARHGSRVVFDPNTGEVLADDQLPKGY